MRGAVAERFARPSGRGVQAAGRVLAGRRVAVVGLARSGLAACRLLRRLGARVRATDSRAADALPAEVLALRDLGVELELGGHTEGTFREADLVVVSPGVPRSLRYLDVARAAGLPVVGEVELAYWCSEAAFAAITGSNGKSTTAALLGAILGEAERADIPEIRDAWVEKFIASARCPRCAGPLRRSLGRITSECGWKGGEG